MNGRSSGITFDRFVSHVALLIFAFATSAGVIIGAETAIAEPSATLVAQTKGGDDLLKDAGKGEEKVGGK